MIPHLQDLLREGFSLKTAAAAVAAFETALGSEPPSTAPSWGIVTTADTEPVPTVSTIPCGAPDEPDG